ncbi:MAG: thioredoxin family protein [Verrucomicrobiales bacterium]|nr:thioredoxin family protein [Verrucomicrobiales bacterium]
MRAQNSAPPVVATPVPDANGIISRASVIPDRMPLFPTVPSDPDAATWERNPQSAFSKAKTQQKPMLLLFTAQWNPLCKDLSSEVFSSKTFNLYAKKNLIICYLDFPHDPLDSPDALRQLKEKFKVRGLPVLLVFDPQGHVIHQATGYRSGRPVDYFNALKKVCDDQLVELKQKRQMQVAKGYREWKNAKGKPFFALFTHRDATTITLKSAAGEIWKIKIATLSPADQAFALSFPAQQASKK